MFRIFFALVLFVFTTNAWSQEKLGTSFFRDLCNTAADSGSVIIKQDSRIEELVGIHIEANKRSVGIDGFRIQLYLGSNNSAKREASHIKGKLLSLFPDEKPYVMYEAPFWRVQVGDFRSKSESLALYRKLKREFPSCYPVPVNNIMLLDLE